MECQYINENLFRIAENRLSPAERAEVEEHLQSCPECSRLLSEFRQTIGLIDQDILKEPDPFTGTRILQHLESALSVKHERRERIFSHLLQPVVLTFSILLAVMIGFSIGKKSIDSNLAASSEQEIEAVRTDLFISDLTDEDKILFLNP